MPFQSKRQAAAMFAAAAGNSTLGIPASVGAKYIADAKPGGIKKLPNRVRKPRKVASAGHVFGALAPIADDEE